MVHSHRNGNGWAPMWMKLVKKNLFGLCRKLFLSNSFKECEWRNLNRTKEKWTKSCNNQTKATRNSTIYANSWCFCWKKNPPPHLQRLHSVNAQTCKMDRWIRDRKYLWWFSIRRAVYSYFAVLSFRRCPFLLAFAFINVSNKCMLLTLKCRYMIHNLYLTFTGFFSPFHSSLCLESVSFSLHANSTIEWFKNKFSLCYWVQWCWFMFRIVLQALQLILLW